MGCARQKIDLIRSSKKRSLLNPQISPRAVFVFAGWGVVAYLFQTILNTATNSSHAVYDPFNILGIAASATEKEIKKHYKRLSVKFHPDKLVLADNQTKEEAESHYIELTKATRRSPTRRSAKTLSSMVTRTASRRCQWASRCRAG